LLAFRAAHPALRPTAWTAPAWIDDAGNAASGAYLGDATRPILGWRAGDVYVAYNRGATKVTITLPPGAWARAANTAAFMEPQNFAAPGDEQTVPATYDLDARAVAIFVAR
jgi:hypothetical protein